MEHMLIYTRWVGGAEGYSYATQEEINLLRLSSNVLLLKEIATVSQRLQLARKVSTDRDSNQTIEIKPIARISLVKQG